MSGFGDTKQQSQQQSVSDPWGPSKPLLQGMLGKLQEGLGNTALTSTESNALAQTQANGANFTDRFAPILSNNSAELLSGGGALNEAGKVNQNYQNYYNQTNPLASNTNYDPYSTPGLKDALSTLTGDITQGVNGQFAAGGREFSGMNSQALGRGLTQGLAPALLGQYNQNVQNQQGAAGNLYTAGNTNAGILAGMQQQALANKQAGVGAAKDAWDAQNAGANAALAAEAARKGIPLQNLGMIAQLGIPIAGLGGQSSGSSNSTVTASPLDQIGKAINIGTSLFGGGGLGGQGLLSSATKFISDRNAKEDISQVGTLFDGTPVYRFRYIGDPRFQIGLMAQDVEQRTPEAVGKIGQWKAVDYKLATDKALEVA